MLINSVKLKNYKQFKDVEIIFAAGGERHEPQKICIAGRNRKASKKKNTIYIQAENSAGKTNLESAFLWGLYGISDNEGPLLNQKAAQILKKAKPASVKENNVEDVEVIISFEHEDYCYVCKRSVSYIKKANSDEICTDGPVRMSLMVTRRDVSTGEYASLGPFDEGASQRRINNILPQELARYFFFKGEGINKIAREFKECLQPNGGKSKIFKEAVERLIGLEYLTNMQEHLIKLIDAQDKKIRKISKSSDLQMVLSKLDTFKQKLHGVNYNLETINENINAQIEELERCENALRDSKDEIEAITRRTTLQQKIKGIEEKFELVYGDYVKTFGSQGFDFIAGKYALHSSTLPLSNTNNELEVSRELIDSLIKRGRCICDRPLSAVEIEKLNSLKEGLMDLTATNALNEFKYDCTNRSSGRVVSSFPNELEEKLNKLEQIYEEHDQIQDEYREVCKGLSNQGNDMSDLVKKVENLKNSISLDMTSRKDLENQISEMEKEIYRLEEQRDRAAEKDREVVFENNIRLYAQSLLAKTNENYKVRSSSTREQFTLRINAFFKVLFGEHVQINVGQNYDLRIVDERTNQPVYNSDGQGDALVFCFIATVQSLMKEMNRNDFEYPLVMDAPFSNLDKRRIRDISTLLTEQFGEVIFLIKDADGEIAKQYINDTIGREYRLKKIDNHETVVETIILSV